MPTRTDAESVKSIAKDLDEDFFDSDEAYDPFIEPASQLVDWIVSRQAAAVTEGYTSAVYERIERWLAAHFCRILDPQRIREEVSTVREVFQAQVDLGLNQTRYGQMAMMLDTQGWLAGLHNAQKKVEVPLEAKRKIRLIWLGGDGN